MFRPPPSYRSAGAAIPRRRHIEMKGAARARRLRHLGLGALLAVASALALFACSDDRRAPVSDDPGTIADELRRNAEDFAYAIGEDGGTLTLATVSEPLTFNLAVSNDASSSDVLGYLFEGLTETSWLSNEVEPALAASWEQDGLTWTFHLRRDVSWHDGEPFTAHDVAFTFNRIIYNPEINASARATFTFRFLDPETGAWVEDRMSVRALDDDTVECVLPAPFAPFLRAMGTAIYPRHILEPYLDAGTFGEVWGIDTDPAEIIGTGPFTIAGFEPGERVVFRRNADYWLTDDAGNPLPYLDRIVHMIVPDLDAVLSAFQAGTTDLYAVPGREYAGLEPAQAAGNFTIHRRGPNFGSEFLTFNVNPDAVAPPRLAWFRNRQFRQAVAHLMDKERIIAEEKHGLGYPQWSSVSPAAGDFHNPEVRQYEYSLAEARRLLDDLGWVDSDGDGVREDELGNPITFSLVTNDSSNLRPKIAAIVQEGLSAVGIRVELELISFGDLVSRLTDTFDWEAVILGLTGGTEPHNGINVWHSTGDLHLWHPNQAAPATPWEAEIDDLYVQASRELDHDTRVDLYHRAQEIVAENVPLIYTTHPERLTAVRNVFGNSTPTLYGVWDIRYLFRTDR